jgi:hypothetical protein
MDPLNSGSRRDALHNKVEAAQAVLRRAAAASVLRNDPLAEQIRAIAESIGALADIYEASEDTQLEIAATLSKLGDVVTNESVAKVHASGVALIDQLAPRLATLVQTNARQQLWTLRLRTILGGSAALIATLAVAGVFVYATGYAAGRTQGEVAANTNSAAMAAGPEAATTWALLMANNDPTKAMMACRKAVYQDDQGRRACNLPVWIEPPATAPSSR